MNKEIIKQGIFQALGVTLYCSLVGQIFWKGNEIFGRQDTFVGPIAILLLFSVSVLICASLVFYKPYKLFIDGKKKEALDVVLATAVFLAGFLLLAFGVMFAIKN